MAVNLGAIPPSLAASELFGAQRGAFTGAVKPRGGFFEAAQGGTLFLDEMGEAPPEVQVMLLRVLETGEMYPVGAQHAGRRPTCALSPRPTPTWRRSIRDGALQGAAAAPPGGLRDPAAAAARAPRGHRPAPAPLRPTRSCAPSARPPAARRGSRRRALAARVAGGAARRYAWPGNVRQLRNVARQLVIGSRGRDRLTVAAGARSPPAAPPPRRLDAAPPQQRPPRAPRAPESAPRPGRGGAPPAHRRRRSRAPRRAPRLPLGSRRVRRAAGDLALVALHAHRTGSPAPHRARPDRGRDRRAHAACGGDLGRMVDRLEVSERALRRRLRELGLLG